MQELARWFIAFTLPIESLPKTNVGLQNRPPLVNALAPTAFRAPIQIKNAGAPCTDSEIVRFEKNHKLRLPADFRAFFERWNGGYPQPDQVTSGGTSFVIKEFFGFSELRCVYFPGVVEFARSPFGDDYAISCRPTDCGAVYFIDHELADPGSSSLKITAAWRLIPASLASGVKRIAASFTNFIESFHFGAGDWVKYLLKTDVPRFRQFVGETGIEFTDVIGTPLVSMVATHGTRAELEWVYHLGGRAPDLVCHAVRNTRDTAGVLRFLLSHGEDASFAYQPGKPYPMGYAKRNELPEIVTILREYGVPEADSL